MGQVDWNTPPTESEIIAGFDTPPTEEEIASIKPSEDDIIKPFSEVERMIDAPIDTIKSAGQELVDRSYGTDNLRDLSGGAIYGAGQDVEFAGKVMGVNPIASAYNLYQELTGQRENAKPEGAFQELTSSIGKGIKSTGEDIMVDPSSAESAVGNIIGIGGFPSAAKQSVVLPVKGIRGIGNKTKEGFNALKTAAPEQARDNLISKILKEEPNLTRADLMNKIKDVPIEHQARVLAEQSGTIGRGILKQAETLDDETVNAALRTVSKRTDALEKMAGKVDFDKFKISTKGAFKAMRNLVKKVDLDPNTKFDTASVRGEVEELLRISDNPLATNRIESILKRMDSKEITLDDMLDVRQRINYELDKSSAADVDKWNFVKGKVDEFVSKHVPDSLNDVIENSNKAYHKMKEHEDLLALIKANKGGDAEGAEIGARAAINWTRLSEDIKNAGFKSQEIKDTLKLVDDFKAKYGTGDIETFGYKSTKGAKLGESTLAGTPKGIISARISRDIVEVLEDFFKLDNKTIKTIADSLKKTDDPLDFYKDIASNKNNPQSIRDKFKKLFKEARDEIKNLPKYPKEKKPSQVKVAQLQKSQRARNSAENTVSKKELAVESIYEKIEKIEDQIEEAIDRGKSTSGLRANKLKLEKNAKIAERNLEEAVDKHAELSNKFDDELSRTGYTIDETGEFQAPAKASDRSDVSVPEKDLP